MFSSDNWFGAGVSQFYNGVATQSLRFDDGSSSHLSRTPSASNRKTHVLSMWIKRCELGANNSLLRVNGSGDTGRTDIFFDANDKLNVAGSSTYFRITNQVFRDTSAWYHLVFALDTTQTTLSNNFLIYLNGSQITSFASNNNYSLNTDYGINGNVAHQIGTGYDYFDGYMAEVNFIDGLSFYSDTSGTPNTSFNINSFGELKGGVWIPKAYNGSYGTNGFRLAFDSADLNDTVNPITDPYGSATEVPVDGVADASGQGNHFDSSGIDTEDCDMPDSPENNFCTYNPLDALGNANTFSEGNLKVVVNQQNTNEETRATFGVSSGKWYWEHRLNSSSTTVGYFKIGIKSDDGTNYWNVRGTDGELSNNGTTTSSSVSYNTVGATGNVIGVYLDMDNGKWYVSVDGTLQNSADLSAGTGFLHNNISGTVHPYILNASSGGTHTGQGNFGQDSTFAGEESAGGNSDANGNGDFHSAVTSPYLALCTANISDDDLPISPNADTQAEDHFNVEVYNGNNDATRTFDIGFISDFAWFASFTGSYGHQLYDSTRGVQKYLRSHSNIAEVTNTDGLLDFDDNGLLKIGTDAFLNESGTDMMIWNWKANGGVTSTISVDTYSTGVPSVASTVQANTKAGFSIVTFPANNTEGTKVGHGLGKTPKMIITKQLPAISSWYTYHASLGNNYYVRLNNTNTQGEVLNSTIWGSADPDDNVFTIGNQTTGYNNGGSNDALAYCFAEVEGYSKFGSFIGNGHPTDGTFIYLGFRPKFFMMFLVSSGSLHLWFCYNSTKDTDNVLQSEIYFSGQSVDGETGFSLGDFVSNGVKLRNNNSARNPSGGEFIYMAFAENPFKYANAR